MFLYEVYDDRAAFQAHLTSVHFLEFDAQTASMVAGKTVQFWQCAGSRPDSTPRTRPA